MKPIKALYTAGCKYCAILQFIPNKNGVTCDCVAVDRNGKLFYDDLKQFEVIGKYLNEFMDDEMICCGDKRPVNFYR